MSFAAQSAARESASIASLPRGSSRHAGFLSTGGCVYRTWRTYGSFASPRRGNVVSVVDERSVDVLSVVLRGNVDVLSLML